MFNLIQFKMSSVVKNLSSKYTIDSTDILLVDGYSLIRDNSTLDFNVLVDTIKIRLNDLLKVTRTTNKYVYIFFHTNEIRARYMKYRTSLNMDEDGLEQMYAPYSDTIISFIRKIKDIDNINVKVIMEDITPTSISLIHYIKHLQKYYTSNITVFSNDYFFYTYLPLIDDFDVMRRVNIVSKYGTTRSIEGINVYKYLSTISTTWFDTTLELLPNISILLNFTYCMHILCSDVLPDYFHKLDSRPKVLNKLIQKISKYHRTNFKDIRLIEDGKLTYSYFLISRYIQQLLLDDTNFNIPNDLESLKYDYSISIKNIMLDEYSRLSQFYNSIYWFDKYIHEPKYSRTFITNMYLQYPPIHNHNIIEEYSKEFNSTYMKYLDEKFEEYANDYTIEDYMVSIFTYPELIENFNIAMKRSNLSSSLDEGDRMSISSYMNTNSIVPSYNTLSFLSIIKQV